VDTPPVITGEDVSLAEQAIRYELSTLAFHLPDASTAKAGIDPWVNAPDAHGRLAGCWEAEHGVLGRVYVLRAFDNEQELAAERQRTALSRHPFGAGPHLTDLSMNAYAPFAAP
jgi:hypothetical protein